MQGHIDRMAGETMSEALAKVLGPVGLNAAMQHVADMRSMTEPIELTPAMYEAMGLLSAVGMLGLTGGSLDDLPERLQAYVRAGVAAFHNNGPQLEELVHDLAPRIVEVQGWSWADAYAHLWQQTTLFAGAMDSARALVELYTEREAAFEQERARREGPDANQVEPSPYKDWHDAEPRQ